MSLMDYFRGDSGNKYRHRMYFEYFIMTVILINAVIAGIMLSTSNPALEIIDSVCIGIFCIEIVIRFIIARSAKDFFKDPLQLFDLLIVLSCLIPEDIITDPSVLFGLRIVRLLRIARFIALNDEMRTIIKVLMKSVISLYKVMALMLIFTYVFAIIGMSMFKLPDREKLTGADLEHYQRLVEYNDDYIIGKGIDPFGSISESMFTLLKVISGDDWASIRNTLVTAAQYNVIKSPPWLVTLYFVVWFIFGAYLLLNLVVGAILQNYEETYRRIRRRDSIAMEEKTRARITELLITLSNDLKDNHMSDEEKNEFIRKAIEIMRKEE
ncbi:MAG: ion transporter [Succinivibrionaceae bacterium]|nr:ion transporter [Succinivibrionaceae bacterium]